MNKFKFSNYKLPHMSKSAVAYHEKDHMIKAEKPTIKATSREKEIAKFSPKPLQKPKPLAPDPAPKQTVSSSGGAGDRVLMDKDSIAAVDAWNNFKSSYTNRKFRGNDERLGPITPEQNLAEYNREKNEFYYDVDTKKMRLIPTDDAEMRDKDFMSKLKTYQLPPKN